MIEVKNILKKFGDLTVLNKISFNISKGDITGLLGPNGAGKTTLIRIMTSYLKADAGEMFVNKLNISSDRYDIKKIIGYLPENVPLYNEMRVKEYLTFRGLLKNVDKKNINTAIDNVLKKCDIKNVQNKIISTLSKGYTQRVGLADALISNPEIIILDEPTSGLDPNQRIYFRELIYELAKEKTIIISSHILSEIENVCNKTIIINKGKIISELEIKNKKLEISSDFNFKTVLFSNKPASFLKLEFDNSNCISSYNLISETPEISVWKITFKNKTDALDNFFSLIYKTGSTIRELTHEQNSLENIFISLTSDRENKTVEKN